MELLEILNMLGVPVSTGLVLIIITFIKIPKLEVNIWQLLGSALSKGLTGPITEELKNMNNKIDKLQNDLDKHIEVSAEERAKSCRSRILRFNDEIIMGQEHTKEHYNDLLYAIDGYTSFCNSHPDFPNSRCLLAIEHIKEVYLEKCKTNSFVDVERLVNVTTKED